MQSTDPGGVIRPWQALMLLAALGSLAVFVVLPTVLSLWAITTLTVLGLGLGLSVDLVGSDRFLIGGAAHLAGTVLVVLFVSLAVPQLRRRVIATRGALPPSVPWWQASATWVLVALAFVVLGLLPAREWFGVPVPPALLAGGIWASAAAVIVLLTGGWCFVGARLLRVLWRRGRRSPMLAGALVTAAVLVPALGYANLAFLDAVARTSAAPVGREVRQICERPGLRTVCGGGLGAEPQTAAPTGANAFVDPGQVPVGANALQAPDRVPADDVDDHHVMADCMERLHRPDVTRGYSYEVAVATALRILRNREDARDVVQQALIAVCLQHEQNTIDDLLPYFVRSVQYQAASGLRRRSCRVPIEDEAPLSCPAPSPEEQAIRNERVRVAEQAYCSLEEREAMVIRLRDFEGLDYPDIARQLNLTEGAIRQRHSRALRSLTEAVQRLCR